MKEARAQGNAIIEQHRNALEGVFEQHKQEALRQSETRLKAETTHEKQQLNMAVSKAQLQLKRDLSKVQNELKKELFEEVRQLVAAYMQTEEYLRLLVEYIEKAEIFREKGTDRSKYFRGQVDKYRWQDYGSSYLPSELNVAYLYAQLEMAEQINEYRLARWNEYYEQLLPLKEAGKLILPTVPEGCVHNAHMFYIKTADEGECTALREFLKDRDVLAVTHYVPLHSAPAGRKYGRFYGEDVYTTKESERLLRLPMYYGLTADDVSFVTEKVREFYGA